MQRLLNQVKRYGISGIINTATGYSVIFLMMLAGASPELSNIAGYIVGLTVSFFLLKNWVFKSGTSSIKTITLFLLTFAVSFIANFATLKITLAYGINAYLCQIVAGIIYSILFFVLSRWLVFSRDSTQ